MARYGFTGKQFLDNAGDPLIDGKLFFYESGTNTPKNTFKDVNLSIPNTNPVILSGAGRQPNIFFSGTARVVLTDKDSVQIEVRDPEGGDVLEGVFSPWNSVTIYSVPDIVRASDGAFYISIINGNQDKDPTANPDSWTQIRFIRVWNVNETYAANQVVQGSDGFLYASKTGSNIGNDPVIDVVNWGPSSNLDVPPVILAAGYQFAYNNF